MIKLLLVECSGVNFFIIKIKLIICFEIWLKKLKNCLSMQSQRDYRESATIYVVYSGGQKSGRTDRRSSERFGTIFFICGHVHWKERGELTSQRTDMTARVAGGIWLCVTFGGRKTHYLVDGFDVLSRSVLPWSINN